MNGYLSITFHEIGFTPGRYRRRKYDVRILGCDALGRVEWSPIYGWIFCAIGGRCNIEVLFKVREFMKKLPVYRSGYAIKQEEKGYN